MNNISIGVGIWKSHEDVILFHVLQMKNLLPDMDAI